MTFTVYGCVVLCNDLLTALYLLDHGVIASPEHRVEHIVTSLQCIKAGFLLQGLWWQQPQISPSLCTATAWFCATTC